MVAVLSQHVASQGASVLQHGVREVLNDYFEAHAAKNQPAETILVQKLVGIVYTDRYSTRQHIPCNNPRTQASARILQKPPCWSSYHGQH
jgi:hypothetical protein